MLRSTEVGPSALVSPFQVGLGPYCQYSYDMEASEERSSDEHYDGPSHPSKAANCGSRSLGATSSACRGVSRNSAVVCAPWIPAFLAATYFQPCERHRHHKKNECTFFCITCGAKPHSVCQHCMGAHAGHQVIQVRRYVYCDVVRACDISPFVDASGVQNYIINSAKVMFLNHRPHSKIGRANGVDICRTCHRQLREGYSYCSLACKVEALTKGETPNIGCSTAAAADAAAVATATPRLPSSPNSRSIRPVGLDRILGGSGRGPAAASYSPRPKAVFAPAPLRDGARAARGPFTTTTAVTAFALPVSPDVAVADASCAALSSDLESSEPGEDTFVYCGGGGGGGGTSPGAIRGSMMAATATAATFAARCRPAPVPAPDPDSSSYGSASSREDEELDYEFNFENPPKRRRTTHITRRPSNSNACFASPYSLPLPAVPRGGGGGCSTDDDGGVADAEAAATAAATLLLPSRRTSGGVLPVAPAPPPPSTAAVPSFFGNAELATPAGGCGGGVTATVATTADLGPTASAPMAVSSRRKQHAPQRAPSF